MGFRFRKSIKILPGVKINLSAGSVSTSIGVRGATVNVGKRGTRATVGLPGSGISYSQKLSGPAQASAPSQQPARWIVAVVVAVMLFGVWLAASWMPTATYRNAEAARELFRAKARLTIQARQLLWKTLIPN